MSKVFWTSATKSGCVGQYTQCFVGDNKANLDYEQSILSSARGGSCVGVSVAGLQLTAKAMPCTTKLFLACQSETMRSAENINIEVESFLVRCFRFVIKNLKKNFLYACKLCALLFIQQNYLSSFRLRFLL